MLRSIVGVSKHSRAFRRAMILEFQPLRSYSETNPHQRAQDSASFHTKFQNTKAYLKKLQTEDSVESERMLKKVRKYGVLSVFITMASIGIAVYDEHFGEHVEVSEIAPIVTTEEMTNLTQDVRDTK